MIAAFRMYEAGSRAAYAWRALFERVLVEADVDAKIIEHRWPEPISALWREPSLACAFMCGWPFVRSQGMQAIAAPVPSPPRYAGLPRYCSEFLVRDDSGFQSLEQTFGHRFGWMAADSQSGFNAPRAHLAGLATPRRPALFTQVLGPLGTPGKALDALRGGDVDVIALDSYYLDLLRRHGPDRLTGIGCVDTTRWTPIPLLVAAPGADPAMVARLRTHLLAVDRQPSYRPLLDDVLLARFVSPDVEAYLELEAAARAATDAGYEIIR